MGQSLALAFVIAAVAVIAGCAGGSSSTSQSPAPWDRAVPSRPKALARALSATDAELRGAIGEWRAEPGAPSGAPPDAVSNRAMYVQRAVQSLSEHPRLAHTTTAQLPSRLAHEVRDLSAAFRDLGRLSAGLSTDRVRTGPPTPLDELRRSYRDAERRFDVKWPVLAAINLVESGFGRVRSQSVAGAQGPMQFVPSTWRAYGLGGDVRDPGDAILGAANFLRHAGAPGDYPGALYAYNPSRLYVDAISRYARVIERDPEALYLLYSWPVGAGD
jgi:membrane-bound lytic murein transglycosylase B